MTTRVRAKACGECGFATDHIYHFRNCVPTRYWPQVMRDRKVGAMTGERCACGEPVADHPLFRDSAWHFATQPVLDLGPERRKVTLFEYRRTHPEANPLVAEQAMVEEQRTDPDGATHRWERPLSVAEAVRGAVPCPRCERPMLDRTMHIVCQPVDTTVRGPVPDARLTPRERPVAVVEERSGADWWDGLAEPVDELPVDESEIADYVRGINDDDLEAAAEAERAELRDRLRAEQEAVRAERVARESFGVPFPTSEYDTAVSEGASAPGSLVVLPEAADAGTTADSPSEAATFPCAKCGRANKSAAGRAAHMRHCEVTDGA